MKLKLSIWHIVVPALVIGSLSAIWHNLFTWLLVLAVFLFLPGWLILHAVGVTKKFGWVSIPASLVFSVFVITLTGLLLNALRAVGINQPLTLSPILIGLNAACLFIALFANHTPIELELRRPRFTAEETCFLVLLSVLPLLAIGGAIRLNNGASNILTMILFAAIGLLLIIFMIRPPLPRIYPFAVSMFALSILFSLSLRGWYVTGHDIHHELGVFMSTANLGFWRARTASGDPYAACLSITILPTILYKLTHIEPVYIFKVVYQLMVAIAIPTTYAFARKFVEPKKALLASFAFITFPTFTNDLPFLNRQEVAMSYFIMLMFVTFSKISARQKTGLTVMLLVGIILAHYSTSYVTVSLLLVAYIAFKVFAKLFKLRQPYVTPLLSLPIILMAFLGTFVWNAQITDSSGNLSNTLAKTVQGIFKDDSESSNAGKYNIVAKNDKPTTPAEVLQQALNGRPIPVTYAPPIEIPITSFGLFLAKFVNVRHLNDRVHNLIATILQLLVIIGTLLLFLKNRKKTTPRDTYYLALTIACLVSLVIFTLFPQLSIGYDVTRLFQQSMILLWLPILLTFGLIFKWLKSKAVVGASLVLVFMFYNLCGFIPQLTGAYLPQLPLNNSGLYYDYFYAHKSDIVGSNWLAEAKLRYMNVFMDTNSAAPPLKYPVATGIASGYPQGYYYTDYINNTREVYRTFASTGFVEYTNPNMTKNKNLIYSNGPTQIYFKWQTVK